MDAAYSGRERCCGAFGQEWDDNCAGIFFL